MLKGNTFNFMPTFLLTRFLLTKIPVLIQDDHKDSNNEEVDDDEGDEVMIPYLTLVSLWVHIDECWNTFPLVCR